MKEYLVENGRPVNLEKLRGGWLPKLVYKETDANLSRICHDIMLEYNGGALLAVRKVHPAEGELWPVGGRLERGMLTEESIRLKVRDESKLEIYGNIEYLDWARTFFETDGCGHGRGTDTVNLMYVARARGELKLDETLGDPIIVVPKGHIRFSQELAPHYPLEEYTDEFRSKLHPYVQDFMDLVIPHIAELNWKSRQLALF